MGSRVRRWFFNPLKTLRGADIHPGQTVLEVGCGTGFFTIPAAQLLGDEGCLVAMDALSGFINQVSKKVQSADLKNVRVVQRDALNTGRNVYIGEACWHCHTQQVRPVANESVRFGPVSTAWHASTRSGRVTRLASDVATGSSVGPRMLIPLTCAKTNWPQ